MEAVAYQGLNAKVRRSREINRSYDHDWVVNRHCGLRVYKGRKDGDRRFYNGDWNK